jgi:hypothetical protein
MSESPDDQPDLVDADFSPFVRALGNLVITFALAEARLLDLVSEMLGGEELRAVAVLRFQEYDGLFAHRAYVIRRERDGQGATSS